MQPVFIPDIKTFREFTMGETLTLATIQTAVLEFIRGRDDTVLFGAQAVNAYVDEARMTQDVDLLSTRADKLAEEIKDYLSHRFHIAVRIREVKESQGYRIFQLIKTGNRHLVDLRMVVSLPKSQKISDIAVLVPEELIASKVVSLHRRKGKPKSGTDWRDLAMLLLAFPDMKTETGLVADCLKHWGADQQMFDVWKEIVLQDIQAEADDDEFSV